MFTKHKDILRLTLSGFSWNIAGNLARSVTGFVINILLARLLGPEPFGIVALAMIVIGIGTLITESGLGAVLIQKEDLNDADITFIFTLQMGIGILFTLVVFFSAPWLALLLSTPAVIDILQVLSFLMVIQAFAQVPIALLRRSLNFKRLQQAQIISYLAGYLGLGLPLAFAGLGVWSLVIAQCTQAILNTIIVYLSARHPLTINIKDPKQLSGFGIRVLGANIANWIIQNFDNMIVGRQFGAIALGFYSRSYFLSWAPLGIILNSAQMALLSSVSRTGRGRDTARIFLAFYGGFALVLIPAYSLLALGAREFILLLYGKEWLPAAGLLVPLALAMPLFALMGLEGPVLIGLGKPNIELRTQWVAALIAIVVLFITSQISLIVCVWSIIAIYFFRLMLMSYQTLRALDLQFNQLMNPFLLGLLLAGIASAAWIFVDFGLSDNLNLFLRLFLQGSVAILVWLSTALLGRNWLFPQLQPLIKSYIKTRELSLKKSYSE